MLYSEVANSCPHLQSNQNFDSDALKTSLGFFIFFLLQNIHFECDANDLLKHFLQSLFIHNFFGGLEQKLHQLLLYVIFDNLISKSCPHSQSNQNFELEFFKTSSGFFIFFLLQNIAFL